MTSNEYSAILHAMEMNGDLIEEIEIEVKLLDDQLKVLRKDLRTARMTNRLLAARVWSHDRKVGAQGAIQKVRAKMPKLRFKIER